MKLMPFIECFVLWLLSFMECLDLCILLPSLSNWVSSSSCLLIYLIVLFSNVISLSCLSSGATSKGILLILTYQVLQGFPRSFFNISFYVSFYNNLLDFSSLDFSGPRSSLSTSSKILNRLNCGSLKKSLSSLKITSWFSVLRIEENPILHIG
ncbi:unnamed protein product [Moneuplotes crassus]|uniref:Uncharacterized protein n=1 Tax=Euplotes crassus TaxID=5936 RepID=A0AAD2D1V9_EUPCR|nr:unnamed protein product [Moneuplotes crassus]